MKKSDKSFFERPLFQFIIIFAATALFIILNLGIYNTFTRRLINPYGKTMQEKSIKIADYLPFKDDSKIVKIPASNEEKFTEGEAMPVLDGATALLPVYSAFFNSLYPENTCSFDGKDFGAESLLQKRNTAGAFKALAENKADIIFCAKPSKKQLEYAKEKGLEFVMVPIGYEAFVFIVNKDNPVENLSIQQIKDIYSGKYERWSEVGGDDSKIAALIRAEGSGSQTAMISFMQDTPFAPSKNIFTGRAIGYSFRYYISGIVGDSNIKLLSLEGVKPTKENIRNKTYPVFSNFYAIYRASDAERKDIKKVIDFALSKKGQQIVEETGYVSLD